MVNPLLVVGGIGVILTALGLASVPFVWIQASFALVFGFLAVSYADKLGFDETIGSIAGIGAVTASYVFINPLTLIGTSIVAGVFLLGERALRLLRK